MDFTCLGCRSTYQPHWRGPSGGDLCRTCEAQRDGRCIWPDHPAHLDLHPCSYGSEQPGEPCRYCGGPVPGDEPCRQCWQRLDEMPHADIRAAFAEMGLSLSVPQPPTPDTEESHS